MARNVFKARLNRIWSGGFSAALVLSAFFFAASAFGQPVKSLPKPTDYVSDLAHVMSPGAIQQIDYLCGRVDHEAHAQIAVVTVKDVDDEAVGDYAVQLYQAWGIGAKSGTNQNRGVLILISVDDRKRFISTGYGLEGILPDGLVGQIGRQMVPMLRNNDFDGALTLATNEVAQITAKDAGVTLTPLGGNMATQQQPIHLTLGQMVIAGVVILLIILFLARFGGSGLLGFLLGMFFGGGWGGGRGGGGGGFGGGGGGGDGFGGFGGGSTGGGGAGGSW